MVDRRRLLVPEEDLVVQLYVYHSTLLPAVVDYRWTEWSAFLASIDPFDSTRKPIITYHQRCMKRLLDVSDWEGNGTHSVAMTPIDDDNIEHGLVFAVTCADTHYIVSGIPFEELDEFAL